MHRVGSCEVQALEGDAPAPSAVLPSAVEPEPFEGLVVQQGTDGGDARPVAQPLDQSLLTAVRQNVAEPLDLGRLFLANRDGLVPAPPELLAPPSRAGQAPSRGPGPRPMGYDEGASWRTRP